MTSATISTPAADTARKLVQRRRRHLQLTQHRRLRQQQQLITLRLRLRRLRRPPLTLRRLQLVQHLRLRRQRHRRLRQHPRRRRASGDVHRRRGRVLHRRRDGRGRVMSDECPAFAFDYGMTSRCRLQLCPRFGRIHFVDFPVKGAPANAELFRRSGDVAVRGCKRLGDQFLFRLVQIERPSLFPESLS